MVFIVAISLLWLGALASWLLRHHLPADTRRGWILGLFPLSSFGIVLWQTLMLGETAVIHRTTWISTLNLDAVLQFDALSALFALLVTGIGTLIIIYAGYYFLNDDSAGRFFAYLFLFMGMMLGLVLAGDVITLFIFWEGTSITSFLLVAYKYKYESARAGAFKALFITAGGGIALLVGLLFLSSIAGSTDFATIMASGDLIRGSNLYLVTLILVALGAFTKSAQAPFHIWLPNAMSAPTPASAYLHSATMVKAGIYLLARFNPALGETEAWFWLLSLVGLATMLIGAYLGTKQKDLKALLAYSTISQLGILMMLIGQDTEIAFKALVIGVVAHAFYKSALFMGAGIIDIETGTRDIYRLGALRQSMPLGFAIIGISALSLAGLPPLFGFLAKETLLATAVHPSLPEFVSWLFTAAIIVAAAFKLVQAGMILFEVFLGNRKDETIQHRPLPKLVFLAPALPALMSLGLGILPEPQGLAEFFGAAAAVSFGDKVKVSFALWTGLNIPFALSVGAIGLGTVLFIQRKRLIAWQNSLLSWSFNGAFDQLIWGIDRASTLSTKVQSGKLRFYLSVMIVAMLGLVTISVGGFNLSQLATLEDLSLQENPVRLISLLITLLAAGATVLIKRDFFAILALGTAGLGVAIYMAVEPAPDVALVQIVVDILATLILILALTQLPQLQKSAAERLNGRFHLPSFIVAAGSGLLVTLITFTALTSRPRTSLVTPFYSDNAKALTGASDIVGAIIVDFRALDTLIEIAVFSLAGLGLYTLMRFAANKHQDHPPQAYINPRVQQFGIAGPQTSVYLRSMAKILLPIAFLVASVHMLYGHDQPGDGFTAGVIMSLAVGFTYLIFGFDEARQRLTWLQPFSLIALGILLVVFNGTMGYLLNGQFLSPIDYGGLLSITTLPAGVKLSSGFLFEVAIGLAVLGSASLMLDSLARPSALVIQPVTESESVPERGATAVSFFAKVFQRR
ncbi:MAG: hydrogen gas-evolving membrane-bound hydrogenase subunit E [Chloroflexota bacterium]